MKKGLNIHKRSDGRWEGRYKVGIYDNGSAKYASIYGKTRSEVTSKLLEIIASNSEPQSHVQEKTFSEILQLWLNNNKLRQKGATEHKYKTMIEQHIEPGLGALKLSLIDSLTINTFLLEQLNSGRLDKNGKLSPSYVRTMSLIIQSAMQFAADECYCKPLKTAIFRPPINKRELQIISKQEQRTLERYIELHWDTTCVGILMSLYTGLRIGEVCALSWEDIDLEKKIIKIRHTIARVRCTNADCGISTKLIIDSPKTIASAREIPIPSILVPYILKLRHLNSSSYVVSDSNDFVSPRTYEYRFHRILEKCGLRKINYHVLRHTFATRCIEAGMDVKTLSELLGHSSVSFTLNTYVHSSMETKRQQLELLNV